jgi:hypothetical protein
VEVSSVVATDPNYPVFAPDPNAGTFASKTFSYPGLTCASPPCVPSAFSGHAMGSGNVFYGDNVSIAQGINDIHSYEVNQWINAIYVPGPNGLILNASRTDRRIANHSWTGNGNNLQQTGQILRIVDRQVDVNEYMQVAAAGAPLLGNAFNAIAVGVTSGTVQSSIAIDSVYTAGRTGPDLVAPAANLSAATPVVSATAALLVQTGHQHPELSLGSRSITGVGIVYDAERAETIKAALMAGADRQTHNSSGFGDIIDYRSNGHQTDNGLDDRYGAGQVDILNSYHIIAGGEQDSLQDGGNGQIDLSGFDYDASFGGSPGSNASASYEFTASADETISAALVWNLSVSDDSAMTTTLHHLGLALRDVTDNTVVASSESLSDNTQNLYVPGLIGGHDYQLQVASLEPNGYRWDYSLAWNRSITATPVPLPAAFWLFGSALVSVLGYQRKRA